MSKKTKIIEFYGLPGCGKTTCCNRRTGINTDAKRIATIKELSEEIASSNIAKKALSFPYYLLIPMFRLFVNVPFVGFKNLNLYLFFLKKEAEYFFARKFSRYDVILIEHGHAQSIISLIYGSPKALNSNTLKVAERLISSSELSEIIYCKVKPETAIQRIRKRNRTKIGRLDAIKDDSILLSELIILNEKFELLAQSLQSLLGSRFRTIFND